MPNLLFCLLFLFYQTTDYRIDLEKYYVSQKQNKLNDYVEPDGAGNYKYVYQYKDIWGNTRVTYADDNNNGVASPSEIRREQNYYPFGMEHRGYNSTLIGTKNNLKTFQQ